MFIIVKIIAEIVWIFPSKSIHVNFGDFLGVGIGEGVLRLYPENGSNVGPSRHVATVNKDHKVLVCS